MNKNYEELVFAHVGLQSCTIGSDKQRVLLVWAILCRLDWLKMAIFCGLLASVIDNYFGLWAGY